MFPAEFVKTFGNLKNNFLTAFTAQVKLGIL